MASVRRSETERDAFVGRREELESLKQIVQRASSGRGAITLITGEQGVGKTRLATYALEAALTRKMEVTQAAATPLESGIAYLPLVRALDSSLSNMPPARLEALVKGIPDLARLMANLPLPAPLPLGEPSLEKKRIFEALGQLLERLTTTKPLVLFIDDLHCADPSSIELIHYLSLGIERRPLLVLATLREEFLPGSHALRTLLAGFRHSETATILRLEPLGRDEIAELVLARSGSRPARGEVAVIRRRTGGNPRLLTLLLELPGRDEGWERLMEVQGNVSPVPMMPEGVSEMLEERLARLDPEDADLLEWIAVCADGAPYDALREVSGRPDAALMNGLRRLLRARLAVEEVRDDEIIYHFTNHMERLALVSTLPEGSRRIRHARWTAALESVSPGDLQRLAYHSLAAGPALEAGRMVDRLIAAGRESLRLGAAQQAKHWLAAALARARQARLTALVPGLLELLAEAHVLHGDRDSGDLLGRQAMDLYKRQGDPEGLARTCRMLASGRRQRGDTDSEQSYLERGLEVLGDQPRSVTWQCLKADLIAALIRTRGVEPLACLTGELEVCSQCIPVRCRVLLLQVEHSLSAGSYQEAADTALEAVQLAEQAREPELVCRARLAVATVALACGELGMLEDQAELAVTVAGEAALIELEARAIKLLVLGQWQRGEWAAAQDRLRDLAVGDGSRVPARAGLSVLCLQALLHTCSGDLEQAGQTLDRAWDLVGIDVAMPTRTVLLNLAAAVLALEQGDPEQALIELEGLGTGDEGSGGLCVPTLLLATRGLACVEAGRLEAVEGIIADLRRRDVPESYCGVLAEHLEGLRLAHSGGIVEARDPLQAAADGYDRLGLSFDGARVRLSWLELSGQRPELRVAEAAAEGTGCLEVFQRLGAAGYVRRTERALAGMEARGAKPGRARTGPLSARELEIARLVAQGLTSDEIGGRLFISTHTVSTHLRRLFERLGLRSRTELARYVIDKNLLGGEQRSA